MSVFICLCMTTGGGGRLDRADGGGGDGRRGGDSAADVLAGVEESGPFITILRYTCVRAHYFGGIETAEP